MMDNQSKDTLRSIIRTERNNLQLASSTCHAEHAVRWVKSLNLGPDARVGAYIPLPGEPGFLLAESLLAQNFSVLIPKVIGSTLYWGMATEPRMTGAFGIEEPCTAPYRWEDLDCALIPALAIDPQGHRLGQGGGFYDRCSQGRASFPLAALIWSQELRPIPYEDHDLCVPYVITEKGTQALPVSS